MADVKFTYPAPVTKPRPVSAVFDPNITVNTATKEVTGTYREYLEAVDANGVPVPGAPPVLSAERKNFKVLFSSAQITQFLNILKPAAEEQKVIPGASTLTM